MPIKKIRWPQATFKKYKTSTQSVNFQGKQDTAQLLNKGPTRNTKQNHMPIKKKVAEGHLQKIQNMPQPLNVQEKQDMP